MYPFWGVCPYVWVLKPWKVALSSVWDPKPKVTNIRGTNLKSSISAGPPGRFEVNSLKWLYRGLYRELLKGGYIGDFESGLMKTRFLSNSLNSFKGVI